VGGYVGYMLGGSNNTIKFDSQFHSNNEFKDVFTNKIEDQATKIYEGNFGYIKTNNDTMHYVWFGDEEARQISENPYLTEIYSDAEVSIFTKDCFLIEVPRCASAGLYSLKPITSVENNNTYVRYKLSPVNLPRGITETEVKYFHTLESSTYYSGSFSIISPNKSKILSQAGRDEIIVIDLLSDNAKSIFSVNEYNQDDSEYVWYHLTTTDEPTDNYLSSNTRWSDDLSIEIELFKFKTPLGVSDEILDQKIITVSLEDN